MTTINPLVANYVFRRRKGRRSKFNLGPRPTTASPPGSSPRLPPGRTSAFWWRECAPEPLPHASYRQLPNGSTVYDSDHSFTTGALPAGLLPALTVQQTTGMTPASGVEMLDLINESQRAHHRGNRSRRQCIWYYPIQPLYAFPIKPLPNGHMLVVTSGSNQTGATPISPMRCKRSIWPATLFISLPRPRSDGLNGTGLPALTYMNMNHDVLKLPNGHLILLVSFSERQRCGRDRQYID